MKASLQGYAKAGILGLLAGLAIVALGAFVVTGRVDAEDSETVLSDEVVGPAERDPAITRAIGGPLGLDGPSEAEDAEAAVPPADDDDQQSGETTDPVADDDGDTDDDVAAIETTTTLPQVIVDPDLFDDEDDADETGDDDATGDADAPDDTEADDDTDGAGDDATPTTTSTTTTTTSTTTTTTTTTTVAQSELAEEMDRILELFPPELEGLLIEIAVFDDQLSFGVASEADADELDAFLTDVTDAPYSIRLATR